ncbi:type II toxin-antitoxin system VapC family toxin [Klenkia sp. PcliD-1-E]|uniref:type II toxin-antitoxin system VapC family toxin n=1 Tax=Klenkia sp. PcliD-1-E TaxID=2954492 RepID=UPI0020968394|nr:type II toxin-antitoxin system VapC family toxin [Klenkia sp. PcliD-1-E]MCO7221069.1 type II toxin-antitoxin system VapC family toxin [Klenkia sp. PcliD-1-E]
MIVDASVLVDALAGSAERSDAARRALAGVPPGEPLLAPGLVTVEVLAGLRSCASDASNAFTGDDVPRALDEVADYGIAIEATPWADVRRAHELSLGSLRYTDGLYVAAAERHRTALLTSDARIGRSGAPVRCAVVTVG